MWIGQLEALPDHIKGIAIDVRGHGSSTSGHGYFTIDVFAHDLIQFIIKLNLNHVVLCGISMGGYIALRAHEIGQTPFSGFILVDTHSQADSNEAKIKRFNTIQSVLKYGRRTFALGFVNSVFSEQSIAEGIEAIELIRSSIRRNDERSICATLLALAARTDTTGMLKDIKTPTLIIRGTEDRLVTHEQAAILKQNIQDAELVELEQCAHLPNLEDELAFNHLVEGFLKRM